MRANRSRRLGCTLAVLYEPLSLAAWRSTNTRSGLEVVGSFPDRQSRTLTRTFIAVAVAWIPLAVLSALRGGTSFLSFLTDYATQSRFLLILPVLILAEPQLRERLALVAHHFEADLVPRDQWPEFQANWNSCERLRDSGLARAVIILLVGATAVFLSRYLSPSGSEFVDWWRGGTGFKSFSLAGVWAFFVSYPILVYFTFLWIWRQLLWARFLRSTTRLKLALIAAHPDHLGGLGFLEASILGQIPFSFCIGVGLAGAIANRVLHHGYPLMSYRFLAPASSRRSALILYRTLPVLHRNSLTNATTGNVVLRCIRARRR